MLFIELITFYYLHGRVDPLLEAPVLAPVLGGTRLRIALDPEDAVEALGVVAARSGLHVQRALALLVVLGEGEKREGGEVRML